MKKKKKKKKILVEELKGEIVRRRCDEIYIKWE
jgi:hypothetical protein